MASSLYRTVAGPVAEVPASKMALASGMAVRGAPLRSFVNRSNISRRVAVKVHAVSSPVKPTAPAKKGDIISAEVAKELYRDMVLGREFEEMCAQMYYRGKMFGFVHLYSGQEAVSTGKFVIHDRIPFQNRLDSFSIVHSHSLYCLRHLPYLLLHLLCFTHQTPSLPSSHPSSPGVIKACLRKDDYICSTYRDHVHALSKGVSARKVMAELFGKKTGCCRGQGGSMHMFDAEHNLVGLIH